ncbi:MAG: OmpA family protein [Terriglobia bacterium]
MNCSGFISGTPLSTDRYVFDGADNDFRATLRQFQSGDFVFLRSRSGASAAVGTEFSIYRSAKELMRIKWYDGQGASVRSLGQPYEDVGRVKVVQNTPYGDIAEVTFACGPIRPGDFAMAYQARTIPQYTPSAKLDRFSPSNGKLAGAITAGVDNAAYFGVGSRAYINLGQSDGVSPGQRFRIFHIIRDSMNSGFKTMPEPPREITGEMVVLSTQEKSSVAMIVNSSREIFLGDGIELEEEVVRAEPPPIRPPTMSCSADRTSVVAGEQVRITAMATDPASNPLTFSWQSSGGRILDSGPSVTFDTSGLAPGRNTVTGRVDNGRGGTAECSVDIDVQAPPRAAVQPPQESTAAGPLEPKVQLRSIYFPTAQPTALHPDDGLVASQQEILRTLANDFKQYLAFDPNAHLIVEGHADQRASANYNNALTERRVARTRNFLVEQGVPAANIEMRSLGEQGMLSAAEVRQEMENNPELTAADRQRLMSANWNGIVWAQNRRVDVILVPTGKESVRRYPFNAKDSMTLLDDKKLMP